MTRGILAVLGMALSLTNYAQNCTTELLVSVLGAWDNECPAGCPQDLDNDGEVNTADLIILVGETVVQALDIVPRWYSFFHDQEGGLTVIPVFTTIRNSELTWEDIRLDASVEWIKDNEIVALGDSVQLIELDGLCDGTFPLTMRIIHNGWIYEREEATDVGTVWLPEDPACEYGLDVFDADSSSVIMSPYWNPDSPEDVSYKWLTNSCPQGY